MTSLSLPTTTGATLRQVAIFGSIGVVSTLAYVVLYAALRVISPAVAANAIALVVTAVGNTTANRRLTFAVRGRDGLARDHAAGLLAFGAALAITSTSLALLDIVAPGASRDAELTVLVAASTLATLVRFLLLRSALGGTRPGDRRAASPGR
jgi:putative flippase GtrA